MSKRFWMIQACALFGLAALIHGGCTLTFDPIPGATGEDGKVTIRIVNNTGADLDPQVFIADSVLPRDVLFLQANKYTDFGVFDRGLLGPYGQETFAVDCVDARVVGTAGGLFDNDSSSNEGDREIILAQEAVYLCGDRITFTYNRSGGVYTVTFRLD